MIWIIGRDGYLKTWFNAFDEKKKVSAKIMVDGSIKYKHAEGSIHKVRTNNGYRKL